MPVNGGSNNLGFLRKRHWGYSRRYGQQDTNIVPEKTQHLTDHLTIGPGPDVVAHGQGKLSGISVCTSSQNQFIARRRDRLQPGSQIAHRFQDFLVESDRSIDRYAAFIQ